MLAAPAYWAWIGALYLILLTWQDYKNNMLVDDRKNFFMMGITFSLLSHYHPKWIYVLALAAISIGLFFVLKRCGTLVLGEADISTITWLFFGFGILGPVCLLWFWIFFGVIFLTYTVIKTIIFKVKRPTPLYAVILITFSLTGYIFGLFW